MQELLEYSREELQKRIVVDVRLGLGCTGTLLDNGSLGLAHSLQDGRLHCCEVSEKSGELEGDAWDLAKLASASRGIDAAVGVATMNAAINHGVSAEEGDIIGFLDLRKDDTIGMVGHIRPIAKKLRESQHKLWIFDRAAREDDVYPDWAAEQLLPRADIALITGTTIINKTVDHVLELAKNAREVAIVGPSTTLADEVFVSHGVTLLSGMIVEDAERALRIISHGGGTRKLGGVSRKVTLRIR